MMYFWETFFVQLPNHSADYPPNLGGDIAHKPSLITQSILNGGKYASSSTLITLSTVPVTMLQQKEEKQLMLKVHFTRLKRCWAWRFSVPLYWTIWTSCLVVPSVPLCHMMTKVCGTISAIISPSRWLPMTPPPHQETLLAADMTLGGLLKSNFTLCLLPGMAFSWSGG